MYSIALEILYSLHHTFLCTQPVRPWSNQTRFGYTLHSMCGLEVMSPLLHRACTVISNAWETMWPRLQSTWKRTVYLLQTHGRWDIKGLKISEKSTPTHSSNGLMNYLWMFRKHNLQCIALKKTSPHNWTQSNAFQDQGCKDNLPIRKTGILEHSTCLLYYWTLIHFLIYMIILVRIILYLQ